MSEQLSLMEFGKIADPKTHGLKDIINTKGERVGQRVVMEKRSEVAKELHLVGKHNKDELDMAIHTRGSAALRRMKAVLAALDDTWTLKGASIRTAADGTKSITLSAKQSAGVKCYTPEQLARAYQCSIEDAREMHALLMERKIKLGTPVDVDSETSDS